MGRFNTLTGSFIDILMFGDNEQEAKL